MKFLQTYLDLFGVLGGNGGFQGFDASAEIGNTAIANGAV